ncbi:MAG TPA: BON domain-containing protein [Gammaproteobacteria bacterium]|nr:BON domain-containing protein [Gammaproteobacteria bacterium]
MNHIRLILSLALILVPLAACTDRPAEGTAPGNENGGVSAPDNGALTDVETHLRLEARLAASEELSALQIDTDVREGTAYLDGEVRSASARELAAQEAAAVEGIHSVSNEIRVVSDEEATTVAEQLAADVDDARITATVKARLLASENTAGLDIGVDTKDRVVTLEGTVDSDTERELAGLIAANTSGVREVKNRLELGAE